MTLQDIGKWIQCLFERGTTDGEGINVVVVSGDTPPSGRVALSGGEMQGGAAPVVIPEGWSTLTFQALPGNSGPVFAVNAIPVYPGMSSALDAPTGYLGEAVTIEGTGDPSDILVYSVLRPV